MKTLFTIFILFLTFHLCASNVPSRSLSKHQAESAVEFLKDKPTVIIFDSCNGANKKHLRIDNVFARHTGYLHFYEVVVQAYASDGSYIEQAVDLAELFYKQDDEAICVAKRLRFFCDPCLITFPWEEPTCYPTRTINSSLLPCSAK